MISLYDYIKSKLDIIRLSKVVEPCHVILTYQVVQIVLAVSLTLIVDNTQVVQLMTTT